MNRRPGRSQKPLSQLDKKRRYPQFSRHLHCSKFAASRSSFAIGTRALAAETEARVAARILSR